MVSSWLGFLVSMSFAAEASCFRRPTPEPIARQHIPVALETNLAAAAGVEVFCLGSVSSFSHCRCGCRYLPDSDSWTAYATQRFFFRHPAFFFLATQHFLEMQNSHFDRRCQAHLTRPATNHGSHTPHLDHSCCIAPHRTTLPHGMAPHGMAPHHTALRTQCCDAV